MKLLDFQWRGLFRTEKRMKNKMKKNKKQQKSSGQESNLKLWICNPYGNHCHRNLTANTRTRTWTAVYLTCLICSVCLYEAGWISNPLRYRFLHVGLVFINF